jgi:predicted Zn-dependent peptidase
VDLESATAEDAAEFFEQYYAPANAVLAVAGDLDVDETHAMIERHFGGVEARPVTPLPDFGEPLPESERRATRVDPLAPMPAVAVGYRVPDPVERFDDHCATVLLCETLCEGESSRLYQRLVKQDRIASHLYGTVGSFGSFQMRDPSMLELVAFHPGGTAQQVLDAIDEEGDRIATGAKDGRVEEDELARARTSHVSNFLRSLDTLIERASTMGIFELEHGRAELVNELPAALARVTPGQVAEAAESWMVPNRRAVVELKPGGSK